MKIKFSKTNRAARWFFAAALTSLGSAAIGGPAAIGEQLREATRLPGKPSTPKLEVPPAKPYTKNNEEAHFTVRKISIKGDDLLSEEETVSLKGEIEGKTIGLEALDRLCAQLTASCRKKGHFLARAYLPQQEITDGEVVIVILEARLESTNIVNASHVKDETVFMRLGMISKGAPATEESVSMAIASVSDLPGLQILKAAVSPGRETGGTILTLTTTPSERLRGLAYIDNHGAKYTGRNRIGASLIVASPTGTGDEIGVSVLRSLNAGLNSGLFRYEKPLSMRCNAFLSASHADYALGEQYTELQAHGKSDSFEAGVITTLHRNLDTKFNCTVTVGHRKLNDQMDAVSSQNPKEDDYVSASLAFQHTPTGGGQRHHLDASIGLMGGNISFLDQTSQSLDLAGSNTQGSYGIVEAELRYTQKLSSSSSLSLLARAQQTLDSKNIDGSRRLGITGPDGLRAYSPSDLLGDNASFIRAEYQCATTLNGEYEAISGFFAEYGRVSGGNNASEIASRSLSDFGVNLKISKSKWSFDASAAFAVNKNYLSEAPGDARLLLKASRQF